MTSNQEAWRRAREVLAGGVDSPVRAFRAVSLPGEETAVPVFAARGRGAFVYDVEGRRYVDYLASWGPLLLGHAPRPVVQAVREAVKGGLSFGMPTEAETRLAEEVRRRFPSMERIRFVSSGTEATMSAIRLARGATGRSKVLKFVGAYHGHADHLLVAAGSGAATGASGAMPFGTPGSAGVPEAFARETLLAPYNDLAAVERIVASHGNDLAALIVEPVAANMGVVPPKPGFLAGLREATKRVGALLIYDEVVTGFRVAPGGAQSLAESPFDGVKPDLTCLGKILGGGLPLGAYGGRAEIFRHLAPDGPVYQAGTLAGNPIATAAALATLEAIDEGLYERIDGLAERLAQGLSEGAAAAGIPLVVQRVASMLTPFFTETPVEEYEAAKAADAVRYARFHRGLLEAGVYAPPSPMEAWFVSAAHSEREIDRTLRAARRVFRRLRREERT